MTKLQWRAVLWLFLLATLVTATFAHSTVAQDYSSIVQSFYPQQLLDEATNDNAQGGPPLLKVFDYATADLNGMGQNNFIIAAYGNGFSGVVRLLQLTPNGAILVDQPNVPLMNGIYPAVTMSDLDGDGIPEAIVAFSSAKGASADWIFKWTPPTLSLIGPVSYDPDGNATTLLRDADFIDLNGDGHLVAVSAPQTSPPAPGDVATSANMPTLYGITGSSAGLVEQLAFYGSFVRATGQPTPVTSTFAETQTNVPYLMTILNGGVPGATRVSSAVITLNGTMVAGPSQFSQQVSKITIPVTLLSQNMLSVELMSAPSSQIIILIAPQ